MSTRDAVVLASRTLGLLVAMWALAEVSICQNTCTRSCTTSAEGPELNIRATIT
jgi:hypothetical protein